MITLKNKIIRNFIAGILACVLVFSILVTLFVTFNYRKYLSDFKDPRPAQVTATFKQLNQDPDVTIDEMWSSLEDLGEHLEVDIKYYDRKNNLRHEVNGRDKSYAYKPKKESHKVVNVDRNRMSGFLIIEYNPNKEPIIELQHDFTRAIVYALTISLVIGIIISLILSENISEPITIMNDATIMIKDGYYDIGDKQTDIRELENLQNNINYLSKNLKNQEAIRKQYAQDISHELRTPLTNLQLYIEAIKDGVIEADQQTMDILLEDVKRLEGLVEGLKKTFDDKVEYFKVVNEKFNLTELIESVSQSFIANAESKNININTHLDPSVIIKSDKDKFTQIMQNLISNAIKAIGSDGEIDIYLKHVEDKIIIKVIDDGIGIDKDKTERIFERFYRIDDARNTKENGHGLGLSITKNFVEALGGKILVDSTPNEGSEFTLTFIK